MRSFCGVGRCTSGQQEVASRAAALGVQIIRDWASRLQRPGGRFSIRDSHREKAIGADHAALQRKGGPVQAVDGAMKRI